MTIVLAICKSTTSKHPIYSTDYSDQCKFSTVMLFSRKAGKSNGFQKSK